ncbi:MlaD family protein [Gordonia sp. NPDC003376]
MSPRTRTLISGAKVGAVGIVTVLLFILVVNAMRNPVDDIETSTYTAEFTDASGLHVNGDVRARGMRIGKVTSVDLVQGTAGRAPVVRVGFTMESGHRLTDTTQLAIKYQNLTGVRYLDVAAGAAPGSPVSTIPADKTTPSFDITGLFNGLQPVLATMNSEQINQFSANAIALLQGDGSGLAPMLDATQQLAEFAKDRQAMISTLTRNMSRIADSMGGRSQYVLAFLQAVNTPINNAMKVLNEFGKTATYGPALLEPIERILASLGVSADLDVDVMLTHIFHSMNDALGAFTLMPNTLAGLKTTQTRGAVDTRCSRGRATLPGDVRTLLGGSEVILCAQ